MAGITKRVTRLSDGRELIYFDDAEQKRVIEKLYRCLRPNGYLFIGHAETLYGVSTRFQMIYQNHGTCYQRLEGTP